MKQVELDKYPFTLTIKVRDYEVDAEGIVNNANYLHYMEHTRHEFCEWAGFRFRDMVEQGMSPVVRRVEVDYLSSLSLGDTMVSCIAMERHGARFVFIQDIYEASTLRPVAKGKITIVNLAGGRLTRGDELAEAFKEFL